MHCCSDFSLTQAPYAGFLSKQQKQDFHDCFALLDTDKTGRLSVNNLTSAFHLLNIEVCLLISCSALGSLGIAGTYAFGQAQCRTIDACHELFLHQQNACISVCRMLITVQISAHMVQVTYNPPLPKLVHRFTKQQTGLQQ